jgi:hypothetical protein
MDRRFTEQLSARADELRYTKSDRLRDSALWLFRLQRADDFDHVDEHGFAAAFGSGRLQSAGEDAAVPDHYQSGRAFGATHVDTDRTRDL